MELLFKAGARDVHYIPVYMKKNRPAYQLNVVCLEKDIEILERIILEITEIKHTDIPPICENSKLCKKCAYFDLCII